MKKIKHSVSADMNGVTAGLDFIEETLRTLKFDTRSIMEALLIAEENIVRMIDVAYENSEMRITVKPKGKLAKVKISTIGAYTELDKISNDVDFSSDGMSSETENSIRGVLLKAHEGKIKTFRKGECNIVEITVGNTEQVFVMKTVIAFLSALAVGAGVIYMPSAVQNAIDTYLFQPVQTMFISVLQLLTAPAVLVSIIVAVRRFFSFSDPGRISIKVLCGYVVTSVFAVVLGIGIVKGAGLPYFGDMAEFAGHTPQKAETIVETITNVVPSNIITPMLEVNTLQIVFIAITVGVALSKVNSKYAAVINNGIDALDELFSKLIGMLNTVIPAVVFISTVSVVYYIKYKALLFIGIILGLLLVALLLMFLLNLFWLLVRGVNPIRFLKKYWPIMKHTFLVGSGISALPKTMRFCKKQLGISSDVYSFSIPFGSIANLDGNCVYITIAGLCLAHLCGVEMSGVELLTYIFMAVVMSVGAPITPGSGLLCLVVILAQIGIDYSVLSLVLGINIIVEMLLAMVNTFGDVVMTTAIAKSEKLMDMEVFNKGK